MIKKLLDFKCHPFIFGLYRIALAGFLLAYFLLLSNRWMEFYGPLGISPIKNPAGQVIGAVSAGYSAVGG